MATQPTDDPPDEELDITPDIDDAKKATKQHTDVNITQESKGDSVIVIQKHQNIQSHYIHATTLTYDTLTIKLLLNTPISKKTSFYVYQCGEESGDYLGLIRIKKNKNEGDVEVDVEDMEEKTIKVAVYAKIHDKQPITNILHITIPEEQDDKPTLPNPISLATIKALAIEMNVKKRKYMVKDITNDKNIIDLGTLNINRKQLSGECMVDIERNHYEYNIAIYDKVSNKQ
eukprot:212205_1